MNDETHLRADGLAVMCQPMRFRVVLALLGAIVAFFGASMLGERVASAADHAGHEVALPAVPSAAAPLCDERGASAYAAEPAPQPIDEGSFNAPPDSGCKTVMSAAAPASSSNDDLSRTPDVGHDSLALLPAVPALVPIVLSGDAERAVVSQSPGDEHPQNDNPPPKPIPWRS